MENYEPFGEEWKKEISRLPKPAIVDWCATVSKEKKSLELETSELKAQKEELLEALEIIKEWKLPETGRFWDSFKIAPMSYEAAYGSNGVRDYFRQLASELIQKYKSK